MLTTVLLDIDNTLLDFHAGAGETLVAAAAEAGIPWDGGWLPTFHEVNDALWREIEAGTMTREELHEVRFVRLFARLGIRGDGVAFDRLFVRHLAESACPTPGAVELLRYLYPRYKVCAASNSIRPQQIRRLRRAGMLPYFHRLFVSEDFGCDKPRAGFFDGCFSRLGIGRESAILIGDSLTADIRGGLDYGITTCWYNPKGQFAPADITPDYTVRHLDELKNLL